MLDKQSSAVQVVDTRCAGALSGKSTILPPWKPSWDLSVFVYLAAIWLRLPSES